MGIFFRKRIREGGTTLNVTKSGLSVSEHVGPITVNSRGRKTVRILPGLSLRFGRRR